MKQSNIIVVGVVGALVAVALFSEVVGMASRRNQNDNELTTMLMNMKLDQERILEENEELLKFKQNLTAAVCPPVVPPVQEEVGGTQGEALSAQPEGPTTPVAPTDAVTVEDPPQTEAPVSAPGPDILHSH